MWSVFCGNFKVDAIRNTIQEITQNIHEVRKKHSAILSAAVPDERKFECIKRLEIEFSLSWV